MFRGGGDSGEHRTVDLDLDLDICYPSEVIDESGESWGKPVLGAMIILVILMGGCCITVIADALLWNKILSELIR